MFQTGLVSISFRPYAVDEIIAAAKAAGLRGIEWGSDVHVPVGDLETAKAVRAKMAAAGLTTCAYGSYYRIGAQDDPETEFARYLCTAEALGAPVIRIWGGKVPTKDLSEAEFEADVAEGKKLAAMAAERGITVTLECHGGTFTDEYHWALRYINAVNAPSMRMYWQPNQDYGIAYNLEAAKALAPVTENIHVFTWIKRNGEVKQYPLACGTVVWAEYLRAFADGDHWLLLEFMYDNRLETLAETAATLREWAERV